MATRMTDDLLMLMLTDTECKMTQLMLMAMMLTRMMLTK